uniref:E3 ubiquitin-protein ligase KEG n=1 Tax=Tetraselmis sp. GSL018 TaxID=582737 RepID=A0A061QNE9_9CHLO|mmetsp:Transcript_20946/g.49977  ORF Transcript_20946/g.49977 Transcript_20946/m.49977 type:complete len:317 (+) Transcript_20946:1067-2017(+)
MGAASDMGEYSSSGVLSIRNVKRIPEEHLTFGELISSEGSSGVVFRGLWSPGGGSKQEEVAIKVVELRGDLDSLEHRTTVTAFEREIEVFRRASAAGKQVCQLYGVSELRGSPSLCSVMKLYGPTLAEVLRDNGGRPFPLEQIFSYSIDCLESLAALHDMGIIMLDFKPANVLLDAAGRAVVCDFDMAADVRHRDGLASVRVSTGTPAYQAPESWEPDDFGGVSVKADVWSFACFMVELADGEAPWRGMTLPAIHRAIMRNCETPAIPPAYPEHVRRALARCFTIAPESRPHASEVLEAFLSEDWFASRGPPCPSE